MVGLGRYIFNDYKWRILVIILVGFLSIAMSLISVWLSKCIIDVVIKVRPGDWVELGLEFIVTLAAMALFRLASLSLTNSTVVSMSNSLRLRVFRHLLYTRWQSLKEIRSGDALMRIIKDTDDVVQLLVVSLPSVVLSGVQLVASLVMLYVLDPRLALLLGIGMPLVLLASRLFYRRMIHYSREIKSTESDITSLMQEVLSNQTVVRTFERQEEEISRLEGIQAQLYGQVRRRVGLTVYGSMMANAAFSGGYAVAFIWSAWCLLRGFITVGTMTSFLQLVVRIQRPMNDLMTLVPSIIHARAALDRLADLLEYQTEGQDGDSQLLTGRITLHARDISFRYDAESPLLFEHFDLEARSGEMIAIMGRTGSGKTTLLRLLLGLIEPVAGAITLANAHQTIAVDEAARRNFVYVPQGNSLFSGTIRDNLLVGDATADDRRLRRVLQAVAADFVLDLPEGLDTRLGERGLGLSEGQAQRLAIARSLLRPGRVFLLDEATSALDLDTERRLLITLRERIEDRIIIFITHHEEVAKYCDKIIHI